MSSASMFRRLQHAIVLCVDDKVQIQALDRSQPMLPMRPGQAGQSAAHDYTRHGTISLLQPSILRPGKVIGKCYSRHRATQFRKFLDQIEAAVPPDLDVHLVMDNYRHTQNAADPQMARQTATLACPSYTQPVRPGSIRSKRFFALLTDKKIRRGIYRSVAGLPRRYRLPSSIITMPIPKPFRWTKSANDILASIERFCRYNTPQNHYNVANFWFRTLGVRRPSQF